MNELPFFIFSNIDGAMGHVDAGVVGFNGTIDFTAFHIAANRIVAHLQWNNLFIMKDIFNDNDCTTPGFIRKFIMHFLLL